MEKLWGGRFSAKTDKKVDDFNSSIRFDKRMYASDIEGSIAHATMLGMKGIIPKEDSDLICKTLAEIKEDIDLGKVEFLIDAEDIHMNIEKILTDRIGQVGKKLHTGRSRNDQVALDIRLYLRGEGAIIKEDLINLLKVLVKLADKHTDTIMPGYTHLQKAQPINFAHHLLAYFEMFKRDLGRLSDSLSRMNYSPLGSGALAGTTYDLDRDYVASVLGFSGICENSLDGVSDRDFAIELCSCLSIIMMHLSRFSEELILWSSNEFSFVEMADTHSTGSSIMPQKKNPDVAELIRGKTGRVYGDLTTLLVMMKGIPLAYNKDMQEDKEAIFDAVDTVKLCLPVFTDMIDTMTIKKETMEKGAKGGYTNATDAADYLVKKGMPFRDAHAVIGKMVAYAIENSLPLDEIPLEVLKTFSDIIEADFFDAISLETCVKERKTKGAPGLSKIQVEKAKEYIKTL